MSDMTSLGCERNLAAQQVQATVQQVQGCREVNTRAARAVVAVLMNPSPTSAESPCQLLYPRDRNTNLGHNLIPSAIGSPWPNIPNVLVLPGRYFKFIHYPGINKCIGMDSEENEDKQFPI